MELNYNTTEMMLATSEITTATEQLLAAGLRRQRALDRFAELVIEQYSAPAAEAFYRQPIRRYTGAEAAAIDAAKYGSA